MAKPTTLPTWNTDGSNRVTPSSGQQVTGWTVGQAPPSSWWNWLAYHTYEWCKWVNDNAIAMADIASTAWTWTAAHIFQDGVTIHISGPGAALTLIPDAGPAIAADGDVSSTGDLSSVTVHTGTVTATGDVAAATIHTGTVTASADVVSSAGNVEAAAGDVTAFGNVTAGTTVQAPLAAFAGSAAHAPIKLAPRIITGDPPSGGMMYEPTSPTNGELFIYGYPGVAPRLIMYVNGAWWHSADFLSGLS